jgi:hypothetical protein
VRCTRFYIHDGGSHLRRSKCLATVRRHPHTGHRSARSEAEHSTSFGDLLPNVRHDRASCRTGCQLPAFYTLRVVSRTALVPLWRSLKHRWAHRLCVSSQCGERLTGAIRLVSADAHDRGPGGVLAPRSIEKEQGIDHDSHAPHLDVDPNLPC